MTSFKLFLFTLVFGLLTNAASAQNIHVKGYYNGHGWVPGYTYNEKTAGSIFNEQPKWPKAVYKIIVLQFRNYDKTILTIDILNFPMVA